MQNVLSIQLWLYDVMQTAVWVRFDLCSCNLLIANFTALFVSEVIKGQQNLSKAIKVVAVVERTQILTESPSPSSDQEV